MVLVIHGGRVMGFWWGAWCTATKGSGVVVWGGGEILIKTYPGTNPCRLSPSPPRFIQPYGTPQPPPCPPVPRPLRHPVTLRTHPSTQPSAASGSHTGNISADIPFAARTLAPNAQFSILRRMIPHSRGAACCRFHEMIPSRFREGACPRRHRKRVARGRATLEKRKARAG